MCLSAGLSVSSVGRVLCLLSLVPLESPRGPLHRTRYFSRVQQSQGLFEASPDSRGWSSRMLALRLVRAGRLGLRTLTATTQDSAGATENVADGVGPAAWTAASAAAAAASPLLADRYAALVQAGTLRHDPAQVLRWPAGIADAVLQKRRSSTRQSIQPTANRTRHAPLSHSQARAVQRLDRLGHELRLYTQRLEEHQREVAAHQARRDALRAPLMQAEEARLAAEEQAAAAAAQSRAAGGMRAWLARALGKQAGPTVPARTQHQRQTLARATVEARLDQQLGPPPLPPPAPKGVYLHGSVGSGKTLLMDLLSTLVAGEGCVPLQRRLHFNSAMVELHRRVVAAALALGSRRCCSASVAAVVLVCHPAAHPPTFPAALPQPYARH